MRLRANGARHQTHHITAATEAMEKQRRPYVRGFGPITAQIYSVLRTAQPSLGAQLRIMIRLLCRAVPSKRVCVVVCGRANNTIRVLERLEIGYRAYAMTPKKGLQSDRLYHQACRNRFAGVCLSRPDYLAGLHGRVVVVAVVVLAHPVVMDT